MIDRLWPPDIVLVTRQFPRSSAKRREGADAAVALSARPAPIAKASFQVFMLISSRSETTLQAAV
jgi:hypothetical protein